MKIDNFVYTHQIPITAATCVMQPPVFQNISTMDRTQSTERKEIYVPALLLIILEWHTVPYLSLNTFGNMLIAALYE